MFTGTSSLAMAEALPGDGEVSVTVMEPYRSSQSGRAVDADQ
jgi:hypothetical protein